MDDAPARLGLPLRVRLRRWFFHLKFMDTLLKRRAEQLIDHAALHGRLRDGGVYVDVGSGSGHVVERMLLATAGRIRSVGLDPLWRPTWPVRRRLRRKYPARVLFLLAGGQRLPLADASADGLTLLFVLHHLPPQTQQRALDEAMRVLKPGGWLAIAEDTPADEQERQRIERWDRRVNFEPRDEAHHYRSADQWRQLLCGRGLKIVHEARFTDRSRREGEIPHTAFLCVRP